MAMLPTTPAYRGEAGSPSTRASRWTRSVTSVCESHGFIIITQHQLSLATVANGGPGPALVGPGEEAP